MRRAAESRCRRGRRTGFAASPRPGCRRDRVAHRLRIASLQRRWIASPGMQIGWPRQRTPATGGRSSSIPSAGRFGGRLAVAATRAQLEGSRLGPEIHVREPRDCPPSCDQIWRGPSESIVLPASADMPRAPWREFPHAGLSPRGNLSQLPLARAPLCAAGCSIFERRHSSIGM